MKSSIPTLSVITLTKNRAGLLSLNLASLEGQITPRDEIVVIDNGSTDATRTVIRSFQKKLPIRAYRMTRGKYPHLYNAGIRRATKDIIVFLDDDCIASPTFLARIRRAHAARPTVAIQGMTHSIPKGNIYAEIMGDHYRHFIATNTIGESSLRILDNKNASIPRSLIVSVDGFCEDLDCGSEDIEFGIRLRSRGVAIRFDPSIVAYHHERTTYREFVTQHLRFARCEGHLDRLLPPGERMGLVRMDKLVRQLHSAYTREYSYIRTGKIKEAVILPLLYIVMACIRIFGYITGS